MIDEMQSAQILQKLRKEGGAITLPELQWDYSLDYAQAKRLLTQWCDAGEIKFDGTSKYRFAKYRAKEKELSDEEAFMRRFNERSQKEAKWYFIEDLLCQEDEAEEEEGMPEPVKFFLKIRKYLGNWILVRAEGGRFFFKPADIETFFEMFEVELVEVDGEIYLSDRGKAYQILKGLENISSKDAMYEADIIAADYEARFECGRLLLQVDEESFVGGMFAMYAIMDRIASLADWQPIGLNRLKEEDEIFLRELSRYGSEIKKKDFTEKIMKEWRGNPFAPDSNRGYELLVILKMLGKMTEEKFHWLVQRNFEGED